MTDPQPAVNPDDFARVIILVYGVLEGNVPFWCYVAVKPTQYQKFLDAQKEGVLNLYEFQPFGEVIISGQGNQPPDAVTLKVAEVYQTDPSKFFQPVDPEAEIARKVEEIEKKKKKKKDEAGSA